MAIPPHTLKTKLFDFPPPSLQQQEWISFDAQQQTALAQKRALFEAQGRHVTHNPFAESPDNIVISAFADPPINSTANNINNNNMIVAGTIDTTLSIQPINPFLSPPGSTPTTPLQTTPTVLSRSVPFIPDISTSSNAINNNNSSGSLYQPPPILPRPKLNYSASSLLSAGPLTQSQQPPPIPARPILPSRPSSAVACSATNVASPISINIRTTSNIPPYLQPQSARSSSSPSLDQSPMHSLASPVSVTPASLLNHNELIPDTSHINNVAPIAPDTTSLFLSKGPTVRAVLVSAHLIITAHRDCTKIWHAHTGSLISQINHPDLKATAMVLRPSHIYFESLYIAWLGFSNGEVWCIDLLGQIETPPSRIAAYSTTMGTVPQDLTDLFGSIYAPVVIERKKVSSTGHAIIHMLRFRFQIWTIDENDTLQIWSCPTYEALFAKQLSRPKAQALTRDRFTMEQPALSLNSKSTTFRVAPINHHTRDTSLSSSWSGHNSGILGKETGLASSGGSSSALSTSASTITTEYDDHHSVVCLVPIKRNTTVATMPSCELWITHLKSAKKIDIFDPTTTTGNFIVTSLDVGSTAGCITCMAHKQGAQYNNSRSVVFSGHDDGKVVVWDAQLSSGIGGGRAKLHVVGVSVYKVTSLSLCTPSYSPNSIPTTTINNINSANLKDTSTSPYLWVGYMTGKIQIFNVSTLPWICTNDFKAHKNNKGRIGRLLPVPPLRYSRSIDTPVWKIVSVGLWEGGGDVATWDAGLNNDWIGAHMLTQEHLYAAYAPLNLLVLSWNLDASKPSDFENMVGFPSSDNISLLTDNIDDGSTYATIGRSGVNHSAATDFAHGSTVNRSESMQAIGPTKFLNSWVGSAHNLPDIIVSGFQETVDLGSKSVQAKTIFKKKKKREKETHAVMDAKQYKLWQEAITRSIYDHYTAPGSSWSQRLSHPPAYRLVASQFMVGLLLLVFVRDDVLPRVECVEVKEVKTGFGGYHGNKGSIVTRLTVDDSSFCFCVAHLAAGQGQVMERNKNLITIFDEVEFTAANASSTSLASAAFTAPTLTSSTNLNSSALMSLPSTTGIATAMATVLGHGKGHIHKFRYGTDGRHILDHDHVFFFGDLNYRIDLPRDTVINKVMEGDWMYLQQHDQLLHQQQPARTAFVLRSFQEGPLLFCPTYKYDPRTDRFDTSEKRRAPAWCDRILWRSENNSTNQQWYSRFEVQTSDHRPIGAEFTMRAKSVDGNAKAAIRESVRADLIVLERRRWIASAVDMFRHEWGFDEHFLSSLERWIGSSAMGEDVGVDELVDAIWKDCIK